MSSKSPLFTVIIPVKNRAEYLFYTLKTCMDQNYEHLEIIVSDDGSTDDTRDIVLAAQKADPRIRYISRGAGIGMRDNFEYTLQEVKSGYVIALGGDDGLMPDGINGMAEIIQQTGMELLTWPAPLFAYPNALGPSGQLSFYQQKGTKIVSSDTYLLNQTRHLNYLNDLETPMFYVKGVASVNLVNRVRARTSDGRFYSCPTPDGYSGIVLAGEVRQFAYSGRPFSIYGLSPKSQGLGYLSNDNKAKLESEAFYRANISKTMHKCLASQPYSPLITLMTVDYLLTAKDLPGWPGFVPPIDFKKVLQNCINELSHGLYGEDRICRELMILSNIAEHHGLSYFFNKLVNKSCRYAAKAPFLGLGINTKAFFFDAERFKINNIVEAANAINYLYQIYHDTNFRTIFRTLASSISYKVRSFKAGNRFPPKSSWLC